MTIRDMSNAELEQWDGVVQRTIGDGALDAILSADRYIEERRKRTADSSSVRTLRLHAEQFASVFFSHWDIGWAVFNPNGEGVESIEATYEDATNHVAKTYSEDERDDIEVYLVACARDGGEEQRLVRLHDAEAHVMTAVRGLLDILGRLPDGAGGREGQ